MTNLIKSLLISVSMLSMSCSSAGLTNKLARGPTLKIQVEQEHIYTDVSDKDSFEYDTEPRIIIESLTPVICKGGGGTNDDFLAGSCAFDEDKPLPEKIEFRYGVWLSNEEADKRFPPIPFEAYENLPDDRDFKTFDDWLEARDEFRAKVFNKPEYKKIREAKFAAMDQEIDWHTYTIYPRQIMQRYHDDMGFINRMRASIVDYTITFHYDMSVTEEDSILYLDPAVPRWLSK
ncbi:hypothetical protein [Psychrobacter celer]|uniref:hypothetical protein n=1 Tax=Psychrobacter celer TaxID=306572 RepID=UPI003FD26EF0